MKIPLNYICFGNHSGYAQASQDMIIALHESGNYDIRVEFILNSGKKISGISENRRKLFKELSSKEDSPERCNIYHTIPTLHKYVKYKEKNVGFATFETFKPPNSSDGNKIDWISKLNQTDAIIAPSKFNYKIFAHENIEKPIFYIPHCYDVNLFNDSVETLEKYDKFTFLFFGAWKERKGYRQLIEAWIEEFKGDEAVQLLIKTDKPARAEKTIEDYMRVNKISKEDIAPILYEKNIFNEEDLPRFLKSVDCLVSPTMGEGFGLPGLQCMALGTPIITTNFSGCQDYANEDTATLIEIDGFRMYPCLDNIPQFKNRKWANVPIDNIRKKMRHVFSFYERALEKANYAKEFVKNNFNYEVSEKCFREMIETVVNAKVSY